MSNVLSQKEAVFSAVVEVIGDFNGPVSLSSEQRKQVISLIVKGFEDGTVELSADAAAKYTTVDKLKSYTQGLVSNWLRKDTRLNGGSKYEAKNPGARAGSGDDTVKALRALRKTLTDAEQIAEVENEINTRVAAFKASQQPKFEINADLIPENLRHLITG